MRSLVIGSSARLRVGFGFGLLCLSLSWTVRAPEVSAHLLGPNQQTAQDADALLVLCEQQNLSDHSLAVQTATQALQIFQALNDVAGMARARMHIGQYQTAQGNLAEAVDAYQAALTYWQQQNNTQQQTITLLELSFIEQRRGNWPAALTYISQAQPFVNEQTDPEQAARIASSFGAIYAENGWPELARGEYERAREYFRTAGPTRPINRMTLLIGRMYLLEQNYQAAATNINEALANLTLDLDKAQCHEYLGQLHIGLQEYADALENLQTSLAIYEAAHNPVEAARVLALIGQIEEQSGALARARTHYVRALDTFQKVQDRVNESALNFSLGKLELKARNYDSAETYFKRSIETTESLRHAVIGRDLTTAYAATVYDRYEAYIECLIRKHKSDPTHRLDIEALQTSELARSRSLAELLHDSQSIPGNGANAALMKRERELRQAISEKMNLRTGLLVEELKKEAKPSEKEKDEATRAHEAEVHKQQLAQIEAGLNEVQRKHAQVVEELRRQDPLRAQITQPTAYTLEQIQHDVLADDQTILVEYLLADEASYAWVVTKQEAKLYELDKGAVINDAADKVYKLIAKRPDADTITDLQQATRKLSGMVLKPLADYPNAQRVIIVADGTLNYVPFQLLPLSADNPEPLIARYEIVNTPSASILGQLRKERRQRRPNTKLLAAFGDPVFASNYAEYRQAGRGDLIASAKTSPIDPWHRAWRDIELTADKPDLFAIQPLLYSKFELQKLSELGGAASYVARGFAASRETLTKLDLSQFAVLHFATHALLDPKEPESTGFFLSMFDDAGRPQNGFFTTPDVYALRAPVDLVVLSACSTGLGKDVRGEGLIGLTSGFMYAGASSVAASLWKVDDQATAELMEQFYANMLQKNMRPADALRAAQNTLRTSSRWQAPHYWAGFVLQGEYQQKIRIPEPTEAPLKVQYGVGVGLLLMLLAGIGWGFWRRRQPRTA